MTIHYTEGATAAQEQEAKDILALLMACYPDHPWGVRVMEGGFFIQHLLKPMNQPYGMMCKYKSFGYSASAMKKEIVMQAGEWLERAGLARRAMREGDETKYVEGVKIKSAPPLVIETAPGLIRDTPHRKVH